MSGARDGLPFWLDEPYKARPPLTGDVEVEACVIGAGVGGLSCARRLAGHGIETLVLERDTVAGGASGRNGGFLIAGLAPFHNDAVELYGRDYARRVYARTLAVQEEMYALAAELGVGDAVRRVGSLRVAASEEEAHHVRRHAAALREDGFPAQLLERDELPPALRRSAWNACLTDHDGSLQPARWIRALAGDAERAGVRICEASEVRAPVNAPGEGGVEAATGSVRARNVIVAADGALPALVPAYEGRVRARRLHMVATEPLSERVVDQLVYARWGYEYFQQRPDGRILAGGFGDVDGDASYTDTRRRRPADLGADRALPARGHRRGRPDHPPLDGHGRLQRGETPLRRARTRPPRPVGGGRLLRHRQRPGLPRGAGARGHGGGPPSRRAALRRASACSPG